MTNFIEAIIGKTALMRLYEQKNTTQYPFRVLCGCKNGDNP
jgi:hypothetical protein